MHLPFKVFSGFNIQFFWTLKSTPYAMKYDYKTSTYQSNTIPHTFALRISIKDGENFFAWLKLSPKTGRQETHILCFGTKNFLGQALFWAKYFLAAYFFGGPNNVWVPKIFWEQSFLNSTEFWTKILFVPNFFSLNILGLQIFMVLNKFLGPHLLDPTIFWDTKF